MIHHLAVFAFRLVFVFAFFLVVAQTSDASNHFSEKVREPYLNKLPRMMDLLFVETKLCHTSVCPPFEEEFFLHKSQCAEK